MKKEVYCMDTIWMLEDAPKKYKALDGDYSYDAAVIGGGMCGVLTAYKLAASGVKTVLLEADRLGMGQTCATTAKITLCHGEVFRTIEKSFGEESLRLYAETESASIREYGRIVDAEGLDCDFKTVPAYLYALYGERHIDAEYRAAKNAGVDCSLVSKIGLPFETAAAMKTENQAQFHPLKFMRGIEKGFEIFENTRVTELRGDRLICNGGTVTAKHIVITTNYPSPVDLRGLFPLKLHRKMAHVCTFTGIEELLGVYIGIDGGYNYRSYGNELIVSGESHISGLGTGGAYERLKKSTLTHFRDAVPHLAWSAEDSESIDGLPYIGKIKNPAADVYAAVGFGTWGMSASMTGASVMCDMICGKEHPAQSLYSVGRFDLGASSEGLSGGVSRALGGIVASRFRIPEDEARDIPPDHGRIVQYRGKTAAVYRDPDGELHVSEAYCPHMKCRLKWNGDDKTWDCPCHGSRFDYDGRLISGPADRDV